MAIEARTNETSFGGLSAGFLNRRRFNRLLAVGFAMFVACSAAYGVGRAGLLAGGASKLPRAVAAEPVEQPKAHPEPPATIVQAAQAAPETPVRAMPVAQASTAAEPPPLPVVLYPPRTGR